MAPLQPEPELLEKDASLDTPKCATRANIIADSSFFLKQPVHALPTPAEIRILSKNSDEKNPRHRPRPVMFPSLGLAVKFGTAIRISEAQTQITIRESLQGRVPVPEVFGWTEDDGQVFIYMELIEGETMERRWGDMNEAERVAVCLELRPMVEAWRGLKQGPSEPFVGSPDGRSMNDILFEHRPEFYGPYKGPQAVRQLHDNCDIDIRVDVPIVFTHDDLVPPNIMLSSGPNPRVISIIDWAQSGWYPSYWEFCKSRLIGLSPYKYDEAVVVEWRTKYLPLILDPVADEFYNPWLYYVLSWGI